MPNPTATIFVPYHALDDLIQRGPRSNQPPAEEVTPGTLYGLSDEANQVERSTGVTWEPFSPAPGGGGGTLVFSYDFSTALTAPPTSNQVRFNAAHPYTAVTRVWVRNMTTDGQDAHAALMLLLMGSRIYIQDKNDHTLWAEFTITADPISQVDYVELTVTWKTNGGALLNNQAIEMLTAAGAGSGAGGDVVGPASAVDNAIALYDGATGKVIKDSMRTIASIVTEAEAAILPIDLNSSEVTGILPAAHLGPHHATHEPGGSDALTGYEPLIGPTLVIDQGLIANPTREGVTLVTNGPSNGSSYRFLYGTAEYGGLYSWLDGGLILDTKRTDIPIILAINSNAKLIVDPTGLTEIRRDQGASFVLGRSQMLVLRDMTGNDTSRLEVALGYLSGTYYPAVIGYRLTDPSGTTKGDLYFGTRDVVTDTAPTVRMTISSAGNVTVQQSLAWGGGAAIPSSSNVMLVGGGVTAHHATHESGGTDPIAALDAAVLTTGTVASARLPPTYDFVEGVPANPAVDTARLYAVDFNGFTFLETRDSAGQVLRLSRDFVAVGKVAEAAGITKGQAVYISGASGANRLIKLARADSLTTLPAIGVAMETGANNAFIRILTAGLLSGVNTTAFVDGDELYVSAVTAGALVSTPPVAPNLSQRVGTVLRSNAIGDIGVAVLPALSESAVVATHASMHNTSGRDPLTALSASILTTGTVPDARFPATLPAASGVNLTALNATQLTTGTIAFARIAVSGASRLLGRGASGAGAVEEITLGTGLTMAGTVLSAAAGGGSGDVVGPASATADALVLFSGTTGKLLKDSALLLANVARRDQANTFTQNQTMNGECQSLGPMRIGSTTTGANPSLYLTDPSQAVNARVWRIMNQAALLRFYRQDDAESGHVTVMHLDRLNNMMVAGRIQVGGNTAAFPALRNTGAGMDVVLADASNWATLTARNFVSSANGNNLVDLTVNGATNFAGGINVTAGNMTVAGSIYSGAHIYALSVFYPGRVDVSGSQLSWYIAGHGSWGLYTNTGFYATAGLWSGANLFVATSIFELGRGTALGYWIDVPFSAANFFASPGTWTVDAADVTYNRYCIIGKTLIWYLRLNTTSLSAGVGNFLFLVIPGGLPMTGAAPMNVAIASDNGTLCDVQVQFFDSARVQLINQTRAWSASTNNTQIMLTAIVHLQ